jgi:hypothetical protein
MDVQSISFQKDLAVYRLFGAVRAMVGMMPGRMTAEDRIAGIEAALADCERERAVLDLQREAAEARFHAENDVRGMFV